MTTPRDTASGFDKIGVEVEPLLIRLGQVAPGAALDLIRDEITALLDGAGLRWSDLAARVAAPSPKAAPAYVPPPPMPPGAEILTGDERFEQFVDKHAGPLPPEAVLTNEDLSKYGYRSRGPIVDPDGTASPGDDTPKPTE